MYEWLVEIMSGKYRLDLVTLEFHHRGNVYKGQGTLRWTREAGVELEAFTDGMEHLRDNWGQMPALGQILPPEHYMRMAGMAQDGLTVEIERLSPEGYEIHTSCSTTIWRLTRRDIHSSVDISREDKYGYSDQIHCVLDPLTLPAWTRVSTTTYANEEFKNEQIERDWLQFDMSGRKCFVRRNDESRVYVRLSGSSDDDDNQLNAVRVALMYLCGKLTNIIAKGRRHNGVWTQTLGLARALVRRSDFPGPLGLNGWNPSCYEPFLSKMATFFATARGNHFANLLFACMDAMDNAFTAKALVVCTMLEELINQTAGDYDNVQLVSAEKRAQIENYCSEIGIDDAVTKRIAGAINRMGSRGTKNILYDWAEKGVLGITRDDVDAWDDLRQRAAHGKLLILDTSKGQKRITGFDRVCNVVNKLMLLAAGYDGKYYDYVAWESRPFPEIRPGGADKHA